MRRLLGHCSTYQRLGCRLHNVLETAQAAAAALHKAGTSCNCGLRKSCILQNTCCQGKNYWVHGARTACKMGCGSAGSTATDDLCGSLSPGMTGKAAAYMAVHATTSLTSCRVCVCVCHCQWLHCAHCKHASTMALPVDMPHTTLLHTCVICQMQTSSSDASRALAAGRQAFIQLRCAG